MSITDATSAARARHLLASPSWTHLTGVCSPGAAAVPLAEVVVGPSGVHVVTTQLPLGGDDGTDVTLHAARVAAAEVAAVLPPRYRPCVAAAVRLHGGDEHGLRVDEVTVATAAVLADSIRFRPRVLSTSEAAAVAERLRRALPVTAPAAPLRYRRWLRRARRRLVRRPASAA